MFSTKKIVITPLILFFSMLLIIGCESDPIKYQLIMEVEGQGNVTPNEGRHDFEEGTIVEIKAEPVEGWAFKRWDGEIVAPQSFETLVLMDEDKIIKAVFQRMEYSLDVKVMGKGKVEQEVLITPSDDYEYETIVKLTALPEEGWGFSGWQGDAEGTDSQIVIKMDGDLEIKAFFERMEYSLDVEVMGKGKVEQEVLITPSDDYEYETIVKLTALPEEGWGFSGWQGDAEGTDSQIVIKMDGDLEIKAEFLEVYSLNIEIQGEGSVDRSPKQIEFLEGTNVELIAKPYEDWTFKEWSGDISRTEKIIEIEVNQDLNILGIFEYLYADAYYLSGKIVNPQGEGIEGVKIIFGNEFSPVFTNEDGEWSAWGFEKPVSVIPTHEEFSFSPTEKLVDGNQKDLVFIGGTWHRDIWKNISLNVRDFEPFRDERVRKALLLAINREELIKTTEAFKEGILEVSHVPTTPRHPLLNIREKKGIKKYDYDPLRAKQLLLEAGFGPEDDTLVIDFRTTEGDLHREVVQELIKRMWEEVGIEVEINNLPRNEFFSKEHFWKRDWPGVIMFNWSYFDDIFSDELWHSDEIPREENNWEGNNIAGWSNPDADKLIEKVCDENRSLEERQEFHGELMELWSQELPTIPLYFEVIFEEII